MLNQNNLMQEKRILKIWRRGNFGGISKELSSEPKNYLFSIFLVYLLKSESYGEKRTIREQGDG